MIALLVAQAALAQLAPTTPAPCDTRSLSGLDRIGYARVQVEQAAAGYRLAREVVDDDAGRPRFAARWVRDGKPAQASHGAHGSDAFYFASLEMTRQEYRLVDLTVGVIAGSPYFSALWSRDRPIQQTVAYMLTEAELRRRMAQARHRVLAIAPYRIADVTYFAALFDVVDGASSSADIGLTASALAKRDRTWRSRGYVLNRVTPLPGRAGRFVAVWRPAQGLSACERGIGRLGPTPR